MKLPTAFASPLLALGATVAALGVFAPPATAEDVSAASGLAVPGTQPVASLQASGVQIYECEQQDDGTLHWTLKAPDASLYDDAGVLVVRHFAGPSWRANDGSQIEGKVLRQVPGEAPGSIAQLLLAVKSVGGKGMLSDVQYVQRLATFGGIAPARSCTSVGQEGRSPYLARYVFLR